MELCPKRGLTEDYEAAHSVLFHKDIDYDFTTTKQTFLLVNHDDSGFICENTVRDRTY